MTGTRRFWIALVVGLAAGILTWTLLQRWQVALLAVVIVAAAISVVWALIVLWPMDPEQTRARASS
jgi:O-antigen ligase